MSEDIYTAYRVDGEGNWWFHDGRSLQPSLAPGFYQVATDPWGQIYLEPRKRISDEIVPIPNPCAEEALALAQKFVRGEFTQSLADMGMLNKLSILLWGVPGTSKSITIYQIIDFAIENGWVIIDGTNELDELATAIRQIKMIEPDRGVVVIWEEFDALIRRHEEDILQLLDGKDQIPDVLYLMTTNYITKLPARILGRTRRVGYQVMFKFPGAEERRAYFKGKIPEKLLPTVDLDAWVEATAGYSIDNCAQVLVGVLALGKTLEEVVEDLALRQALATADSDSGLLDPSPDDGEDECDCGYSYTECEDIDCS